jgi:hypothetical protein
MHFLFLAGMVMDSTWAGWCLPPICLHAWHFYCTQESRKVKKHPPKRLLWPMKMSVLADKDEREHELV